MKRMLELIGVAVLALSVTGCSKPSGGAASEPATELVTSQREPTAVAGAITLAYNDRLDEAVALLLEGTAPASGPVEPLACLGLSESEIVRAGEAAMTENTKAGNAARALARAALAKAAEARAQGDAAKAAAYAQRVKTMGTELAQDSHNKLLRMIGQAIEKKAAEAGG